MELTFTCSNLDAPFQKGWKGKLKILNPDTGEMVVTARGSYFHIFCGSYCNGHYLCIPNINVGTDLGPLDDTFWNEERLRQYFPKLSDVDIISITRALAAAKDYLNI